MGIEAATRWFEIFEHTPPHILKEALQKVTAECERMPTPGNLSKAITIVRERFPEQTKTTPIGPEIKDTKGRRCRKDLTTGELLYRATDCPEGQTFLLKMAEYTGKSTKEVDLLWRKWTSQ